MALLDEPSNRPIVTPWLDLLDDAPFFMAWHELHSHWARVNAEAAYNVSLLADFPIVQLVCPSVEVLQGSGKVIAWLKMWHMMHRLEQASCTLPDHPHSDLNTKPNRLPCNHILFPTYCYSAKCVHVQMQDASSMWECSLFMITCTTSQPHVHSEEHANVLELSQLMV